MKIAVHKTMLIAAIEKRRRLVPGHWIDPVYGAETIAEVNKQNCSTCAVGALMCDFLHSSMRVDDVEDMLNDALLGLDSIMPHRYNLAPSIHMNKIEEMIDRKHYLNALSYFFEWVGDDAESDEAIKDRLVDFIRDKFPARIEIEIGNLRPADPSYLVPEVAKE